METKDELKEMLVNNAASWGKKEGDDMAEIYVDDFLNELLSKFKLLPIPVVSDMLILTPKDAELFFNELMNPKEANEAFKKAMLKFITR